MINLDGFKEGQIIIIQNNLMKKFNSISKIDEDGTIHVNGVLYNPDGTQKCKNTLLKSRITLPK